MIVCARTVSHKQQADARLVLHVRQTQILLDAGQLGGSDVLSIEVVEDVHDDNARHDDQVQLQRRAPCETGVFSLAEGCEGWRRDQLDGIDGRFVDLGGGGRCSGV